MDIESRSSFQSLVISHPGVTYSLAASVLAGFSLSPTPVVAPLIILLTVLRLSAWTFHLRSSGKSIAITQITLVSLASRLVHLAPSLDALSTPNVSLAVLSVISILTSTIGLATIWAGCFAVRFTQTPWAQLTLFPALWASVWGLIAHISPVGHLATWSPVIGVGPYSWIREYLGQWGIDWITAAWAVIFSEVIGNWLVGSGSQNPTLVDVEPLLNEHAEVPSYHSVGFVGQRSSYPDQDSTKPLSRSRSVLILAGTLVALMIPNYAFPYLPLPINSEDTTPFGVSCALPSTPGRIPRLNDYIAATKTLQSTSDIIIWPESAVSFGSQEEKFDAFEKIKQSLSGKKYVGVSFEEFAPGFSTEANRKRNGFALLHNNTGPPVLEYFKRNLVPIAESFSLTRGTAPPSLFTLELGAPKGVKGPKWAPGPNYTRPVPVTASICLDFATPSSFTDLESRPALILAPARTWHVGIGYAMWQQVQARARETGSTIVWCDGGVGGLGGIASSSYNELIQVGGGSWTKRVGIQYPFNQHRTFFSAGGNFTTLVLVWSVLGLGWVGEAFLVRYRREGGTRQASLIQRVVGTIRSWSGVPKPSEQTSLLHD